MLPAESMVGAGWHLGSYLFHSPGVMQCGGLDQGEQVMRNGHILDVL